MKINTMLTRLLAITMCAAPFVVSESFAGPSETPPMFAKCSMQEEMSNAERMLDEGRYAEATAKSIWLWDHMLEEQPSMYGVRLSFFVSDLQRLTAKFEPAHDAFVEKRDALNVVVQAGNPNMDEIVDWFALNEVVHEPERSEAWVLSLVDRPNGPELFRLAGHRAETILLDNDHFELYGKLCPNLVADARQEIRHMSDLIESMKGRPEREMMIESIEPLLRDKVSQQYLVCLKINEPLLAEQIAIDFFEAFDSEESRAALIKAALNGQAVNQDHIDWIDAMDDPSPSTRWLREKAQEQLDAQPEERAPDS